MEEFWHHSHRGVNGEDHNPFQSHVQPYGKVQKNWNQAIKKQTGEGAEEISISMAS